jgi:hypothetical protein
MARSLLYQGAPQRRTRIFCECERDRNNGFVAFSLRIGAINHIVGRCPFKGCQLYDVSVLLVA